MKNKKMLIVAILAFVLFIGGASVLYNELSKSTGADNISSAGDTEPVPDSGESGEQSGQASVKVEAPDFTVYDLNGDSAKLSDFLGKPVVLNFWASWCGPCKSEMPEFDEAARKLSGEVVFLMINMTDGSYETVKTASEFIKEQGYAFPVFYDTDSEAAAAYGVTALPTTFFIDEEGAVKAYAAGAISQAVLEKGISMITDNSK